MKKTDNTTCPACGKGITVWFDLNTEARYAVRPDGGLSKAVIVTDDTGEPRFGIRCQACSWVISGQDDDIDRYDDLVRVAGKQADGIRLTIKR